MLFSSSLLVIIIIIFPIFIFDMFKLIIITTITILIWVLIKIHLWIFHISLWFWVSFTQFFLWNHNGNGATYFFLCYLCHHIPYISILKWHSVFNWIINWKRYMKFYFCDCERYLLTSLQVILNWRNNPNKVILSAKASFPLLLK